MTESEPERERDSEKEVRSVCVGREREGGRERVNLIIESATGVAHAAPRAR